MNQKQDQTTAYVYLINANFSFTPNIYFFPFDMQNIYIEYQFLNLKDGFLHPVPDKKIDTVEIDGWSYVNGYCGIKRNTNYINIGPKFIEKVEDEKTVEFGLMLKRLDTVLFIKLTGCTAVLLLVNYYCVLYRGPTY